MWDLPDNWNSYWRTCEACGQRYHASGTDPCACDPDDDGKPDTNDDDDEDN